MFLNDKRKVGRYIPPDQGRDYFSAAHIFTADTGTETFNAIHSLFPSRS
jgi:hypothetical protein